MCIFSISFSVNLLLNEPIMVPATCHKRTAPNIIGTKLEMNTFKMIVMNGRAGTMMGSFSSKFTEKEIENIHTYLSNAKK